MRSGCYDPKVARRRHGAQLVEASLCFPDVSPVLRPDLSRSSRQRSRPRSSTYNDWMVEEWWRRCSVWAPARASSRIIPLWDAGAGQAKFRRKMQMRTAVRFQRDRAQPRSAEHPLGYWDPLPPSPREQTRRSCACTSARRRPCPRPRPTPPAVQASHLSFKSRCRRAVTGLPLLRRPCSAPVNPKLALLGRSDRLIPYILERLTTWVEHRVGRCATSFPNRHRLTTTARCTGASSAIATGSTRSTRGASTTRRSRPTTRTPTPRGRNTKRRSHDLMGHLPDDVIYKLTRGNAIRMLARSRSRSRPPPL